MRLKSDTYPRLEFVSGFIRVFSLCVSFYLIRKQIKKFKAGIANDPTSRGGIGEGVNLGGGLAG